MHSSRHESDKMEEVEQLPNVLTDDDDGAVKKDGDDQNTSDNPDIKEDNSVTETKPGYACIKKQYIAVKPIQQPQPTATATDEYEPPVKRQKLKGCNKNRPRNKRQAPSQKMCPAIVRDEICTYGDSCKFLHDVVKFVNEKLPDISDDCHVFKTFGKCPSGVRCRFSSCHLDENFKNLVNHKLCEQMPMKEQTQNALKKDLQKLLWKKNYNFDRANKVVSDGFIPRTPEEMVRGLDYEALRHHRRFIEEKPVGCITDEDVIKLQPEEKKMIDFSKKLYLAPLTTVGNLPFRRLCKRFGADVTCGEMAMSSNILQGKQSEWSLIKRHVSEDIFGVQLCGAFPDTMTRCAQLLNETTNIDFVDINCGCPIDMVYQKGAGSALLEKTSRFEKIVRGMTSVLDVPLTAKVRTGISSHKNIAHNLMPKLREWGVSLVTLHGRSREQRYTRLADWDYINECSLAAAPMPLFGSGDVLSYEDYYNHLDNTNVSGIMIGRGALIKPWIFTEIKERRHWDISATERLDILKDYANFGLEHWGSDFQGVENTRGFLLEWLSFGCRYIPVGLLERPPQKINERPPQLVGRNDLETLLCSSNASDWVKISEMFLGPVPDDFKFLPKHKANAY